MTDVVYMTAERVKEIEQELYALKTKGRREIAQKIAEARSHGDLSENAEYEAAKHAQELHELKISNFEQTLSRVQVIKPEELPNDKIYILSKVKLKNLKTGSFMEFILVSDEEADFEKKKLSIISPIGRALIGKAIGDTAEVIVPAGKTKYKILDISR